MLVSVNMEVKFQLLSLKKALNMVHILLKYDLCLFYAKIFVGVVLKVGSSFLLDPTLNTSQASPPQSVAM